MPASYITAAEAELTAKATTYLNNNSAPNTVYEIVPDPVWLENNLVDLSAGDIIEIDDTDFGVTVQTKIIDITQSVANPYLYQIKVGNKASVSTLTIILDELNGTNDQITVEKFDRTQRLLYQSKKIRDLQAAQDGIFDVDGYFDSTKIKPASIGTLALEVGSRSLNLQFEDLEIETNYNSNKNQIRFSACTLHNLTIEETPRSWTLPALTTTIVDDNARYIYAKVVSTAGQTTGVWDIDTAQKQVEHEAGFYYFLVGILHSVRDNARGISLTYGQSFINGRYISTGRIQSLDTLNYFDLDTNQFKIGSAVAGLDWNVTAPNTLTLKGALVQSPAGDNFPATVYRGAYSATATYYDGDVVSYNGQTFVYVFGSPTIGQTPADNTYWDIWAAAGSDGVDGSDGAPGADGQDGAPGADGETGPQGPIGPQGIQGLPGADGLNGTNGTDGADGQDGADGFGGVPGNYAPARVGGVGLVDFLLDASINQDIGYVNTGEVACYVYSLRDPEGNQLLEGRPYSQNVNTPLGEGAAGRIWLIWSDTNWSARSVSNTIPNGSIDGRIIPVHYHTDGKWYAAGNTTLTAYEFTFGATDTFIAVIEATTTNSGLTGMHSFIKGGKGYDAQVNERFHDDFTLYKDLNMLNEEWEWVPFGGGGEIDFVGGAGAVEVGGQAMRVGNNSGSDQRWFVGRRRVPFDKEDLYRITAKVTRTSGSGNKIYVGVCGFTDDGVTKNNVSGLDTHSSQHYFAAAGDEPPIDQVTTYVGYFAGASTSAGGVHNYPDDPGNMRSNTAYISPLLLVNYNGQPGQYLVHSVTMEKVEDLAPVHKGTWVSGNTYKVGDMVFRLGSTYVARRTTFNDAPESSPSDWRLVAEQGQDGADGADGAQGPAGADGADGNDGPGLVFLGDYTTWKSTTFYNNALRRDVIKYSGAFYIYNGTDGATWGIWNASQWQSFGASFESVATDTLLANGAFLADWKIVDGHIASQAEHSGSPQIELDGTLGKITAQGTGTGWFGTNDISFVIDPSTGEVKYRVNPNGNFTSEGLIWMTPEYMEIVMPGRRVTAGDLGTAEIAAQFTNNNSVGSSNDKISVYAKKPASNNGTGGKFGLVAEQALLAGLYLNPRTATSSFTMATEDTFVYFAGSVSGATRTATLPADPFHGQVHYIARMASASITLAANTGQDLWVNSGRTSTLTIARGDTVRAVWIEPEGVWMIMRAGIE